MSIQERREENKKEYDKVVLFNWSGLKSLKKEAQKLIDKHYDMSGWEYWICSPKLEQDYIFKMYFPYESSMVDYPPNLNPIIEKYNLHSTVEGQIQQTVIYLMKKDLEIVMQMYDDFWLEVDGYRICYKIDVHFRTKIENSMFSGLVLSIWLTKYI